MKLKSLFAGVALASAAITTNAAQVDITVTNLTQGIYFTPIIVAAHTGDASLYQIGQAASPELQAMAEGGSLDGLESILMSVGADIQKDPVPGLLAPAMSTMTSIDTSDGNNYLSLAAMMLPTNDGFVGLSSWMIPTEPGTYHIHLNAYDAGTEANDEIVNGGGAPGTAGIPASPGGSGTGGTGVTSAAEHGYIHVHRGNLGDDDDMGGKSDLDNTVHRWLNPVAKVTIVVN